ncbi:CDP-alcohol phosphatidyltransferase family protein [Flavobacteriaceae bacterium]|nr:phosphatidylserine synthase [Flavobacteriaceae bacterium]MDA7698902.1 CDP-alcohol phosphatidyltransferase family protein [Flavobacteriaceae bacterium]MDA9768411.1 CDP-alcohol phosphatidyltransferase family protein [Flavobacteriaceae bacterium]MDB2694992.1 CDP-alcohol phosphatidyltransferase family protein [Flavobacteriaceae bacterium]MDB4270205.1 CDP-alcohol phosphatidyltransferase family protein [Flavobacteriaceae bacterium]
MRLIIRNIPNLFTSLNFICGCFAATLAYKNLFEAAFLMVLLGTFFDLFDGLFARLLKAESQFGLQFDSMADLITSGIVPGVVMYKLFLEIGIREIDFTIAVFQNDFTFSFAPLALVGFLISLGAAIRLSNFNIDAEQRYEFKGLPAPANALFIVALPLLMEHPLFAFLKPLLSTYTALLFIVILSAVLMNVRLSLFSFKIQTFSIRDYGFQMFLVILALPSFYFLQWAAVPVMIVLYLFLNVIRNSFK